ncbi:MAG: hypothetical protein JXR30_02795, partial [Alphaproteobacteria bacterium]|nr:hypothetical protein [Alphaproteobacteria bacterium]
IFQMFKNDQKRQIFFLMVFSGFVMDFVEGVFPLNTLLLMVLFFVSVFQKVIPYFQNRLMLFLGFLTFWITFIVLKTMLMMFFFDVSFSISIFWNVVFVIFSYLVFEILRAFVIQHREGRFNVRR